MLFFGKYPGIQVPFEYECFQCTCHIRKESFWFHLFKKSSYCLKKKRKCFAIKSQILALHCTLQTVLRMVINSPDSPHKACTSSSEHFISPTLISGSYIYLRCSSIRLYLFSKALLVIWYKGNGEYLARMNGTAHNTTANQVFHLPRHNKNGGGAVEGSECSLRNVIKSYIFGI